jgi:hypothetical protein
MSFVGKYVVHDGRGAGRGCGHVFDIGYVTPIARYADCTTFKCPGCYREIDDRIGLHLREARLQPMMGDGVFIPADVLPDFQARLKKQNARMRGLNLEED